MIPCIGKCPVNICQHQHFSHILFSGQHNNTHTQHKRHKLNTNFPNAPWPWKNRWEHPNAGVWSWRPGTQSVHQKAQKARHGSWRRMTGSSTACLWTSARVSAASGCTPSHGSLAGCWHLGAAGPESLLPVPESTGGNYPLTTFMPYTRPDEICWFYSACIQLLFKNMKLA